MKTITFFLSLLAVITFSSCKEQSFNPELPEDEVSFYITGVSQSLTYTFTSGRLEETPDNVRELNILIVDDRDSIVYEQWYFNNNYYAYLDTTLANGDIIYYKNTIPDTLFIPALPPGDYNILASTTWMNYYSDPIYNPDGTWSQGPMMFPRIEGYNASENPIYVGKTKATIAEDNQEIVLNMRNISARITLNREDDTSIVEGGRLELIFNTKNSKYYSFANDAFLAQQYDYQLYTYLYHERKKHFYVLPSSLTSVTIAYFHDTQEQYNFRIEVPIDPDIDLQISDAISFSIFLDDLLEGARSGAVLWPEITWNDLGAITIP